MLKRTTGQKIFAVFNTIGLLLLSLIFLLPVWHVLMGSVSDPLKVSAHSGVILRPLGEVTLSAGAAKQQHPARLCQHHSGCNSRHPAGPVPDHFGGLCHERAGALLEKAHQLSGYLYHDF